MFLLHACERNCELCVCLCVNRFVTDIGRSDARKQSKPTQYCTHRVMAPRSTLILSVALLLGVSATPEFDAYIEKKEAVFSWVDTQQRVQPELSTATAHVLNVTSLEWLDVSRAYGPTGSVWTHQVAVVVPKVVTEKSFAVSVMTGGCNENPGPVPEDEEYLIVAGDLAMRTGAIAVVIYQIPNCHIVYPSDPDKKRRSEDAMIAWAWRQYLDDPHHDPEWLPRFPMAKAGFQCMRAAAEYVEKAGLAKIDSWFVSGASKRGWTTWMVGAADCKSCVRIRGIAPLVPIVPNLMPDVHQQFRSYGGFTFAFRDYMDAGIVARLDTPAAQLLVSHVDPASYMDRLSRPNLTKVAVLSSNDEFMQMDWTGTWPRWGGESHVLIVPNSEHSLATGIPEVLSTLAATFSSVAAGADAAHRLSITSSRNATTGELTVTIDDGPSRPKLTKVVLRHAQTLQAARRDFRWVRLADPAMPSSKCSLPGIPIPPVEGGGNCLQPMLWHSVELKPVAGRPNVYKATPPAPTKAGHWVGYYIEALAQSPQLPLSQFQYSTPGYVWPDTFPHADCPDFAKCNVTLV